MNKQRLLWVILSVTALVIIILAAGLWLVRDKQPGPVADVMKEQRPSLDVFEIPYRNTPLPGLTEPETAKTEGEKGGIEKQDFAVGENTDGITVVPDKTAATEPTIRTTPAPVVVTPQKTTSVAKTAPTQIHPRRLYWIQTGSYKSKSKADSCNAVLIENGLSGRITSKVVDSETYFRVRIGPYTNKREAEKFLAWIKKIDGLEESYISLETAAKN